MHNLHSSEKLSFAYPSYRSSLGSYSSFSRAYSVQVYHCIQRNAHIRSLPLESPSLSRWLFNDITFVSTSLTRRVVRTFINYYIARTHASFLLFLYIRTDTRIHRNTHIYSSAKIKVFIQRILVVLFYNKLASYNKRIVTRLHWIRFHCY